MGATGYHVPAGQSRKTSAVQYLTDDCHVTVHYAAVRGSVVYAAFSRPETPDVVEAMVCLTWTSTRDYFNFTIKLVHEEMGPYDCDAPAKLLNMLTPLPYGPVDPDGHDYTHAWRARCRATIEKRAEAKRVKAGATIRLATPLEFSDGVERDTFTYEKGSQFVAGDGVRVRITKWRDREFSVVA